MPEATQLPVSLPLSCAMQGRVRDVKWNDDLGRIASLDADGTVRLWDAELELVQEVSLGPDSCLHCPRRSFVSVNLEQLQQTSWRRNGHDTTTPVAHVCVCPGAASAEQGARGNGHEA